MVSTTRVYTSFDKSTYKTLRIVHVVRSALYGGVENHVFALCKQSRTSGCHITLVSLVNCEAREDFKALGIPIFTLSDSMSWSLRPLRCVIQLVHVLRQIRPDVVHLHGIRPILVGSLACTIARMGPVVSSLHGAYSLMAMDRHGKINKWLLGIAKMFHWLGFTLSDRLVLDCENLKNEVREVYHGINPDIEEILRRKVRVVHNGIDLSQFDGIDTLPDIRKQIGIPSDSLVVGTVTRLDEPKKGIGILLKAASCLLTEGLDIHFVVAGDGDAQKPLEATSRNLGIANRVHFLGRVEDIRPIYRTLDVFVLPSLSEGFPTVNLEAMASGLPVVTTDVGGSTEAIRNGVNGLVVPPGDDGALAHAIRQLCEDPNKRKTMGAIGKNMVGEDFGSEAMGTRMFAVYAEVLKPRRGGNLTRTG
jgi:glycosyltransferase involved in cell wall biosynthesis